jgi:hypothetical protein
MDPYARFHPCLSSPASGSPSSAVLHAPLLNRHWKAKWWCSGAEMESPRISYVRRLVGSGNVVMIASGPAIPAEQ